MHETRHKHVENILKLGGIQQENAICKQWTNLVKKTLCNAKKNKHRIKEMWQIHVTNLDSHN
jgi:hypothetical protein